MLIANSWREYEVLDTGEGAKLEKWGSEEDSYLLSRPDPQIIWPKERIDVWQRADGIYTRSAKGGGSWNFPNTDRKPPERWVINYTSPVIGALKFQIRPTDFKHTGLFPEQAANWDWMAEKIKNQDRKLRVLNLFAYTGAATVACAKAGAEVTHVDSARGMVEWAGENAGLNNIEARWVVDDVQKFVLREGRRESKYDAIIMDPPSYGKGKTGETWKIEKMLWPLIESCVKILSDKPVFFLLNSYTTGLGPTAVSNIMKSALAKYGGNISSDELALPISGGDKLLPAGVSGRWSR